MSTRLIGIIILIAGLTMTPSGAEMMTKTFGETALTYYSIIGWLVAACGAAVIFLGPKRAAMPANAAQVQPPPHAQAAPQSFAPPAQGFVPPAQSFAPPAQSFAPPVQSYNLPGPAAGERRCPSCARVVPPGKHFCTGCGTRVG